MNRHPGFGSGGDGLQARRFRAGGWRSSLACNQTPGKIVPRFSERGFALVITLAVLALLVLTIFSLSALARINSRMAAASLQQSQARQNALLALNFALGELQRCAGPDSRLTSMAGVAGVPPQSTFRQWTGVWGGTRSPVWLVSGETGSFTPSLTGTRVTIVGPNSVGSPTDTTDQELVEVGLINLPGVTVQGLATATGRIGYWVGDEGVKVSAVIADDELQTGPASGLGLRPNFRRLIGAAFNPVAAINARVISLEQLKVAVTGFSLPGAFHSLTRSHLALGSTAGAGAPRPGNFVVGAFNINTTSEAAWRAQLEFPDSASSFFGLSSTRTLSAARQIRDRVAARAQPFNSISELLASNLIQQSFDNAIPKVTTVTQVQFLAELAPVLAVRSDTFRIRGYGDTLDPVDQATVQSAAFCEAMVQRTPALAPGALGRRFIVIYFRWLGRDDI